MFRRRYFMRQARRAKLPPGYRRLKRAVARDLQTRLNDVVTNLRDEVESIAKEFKRSPAWVRGQLFGRSKNSRFLRRIRKTRLYDAYLHFRAKEINGALPEGSKKDLFELKEIISRERRSYKTRPAEEQAVWIAEYEADKESAARDKRINRKAEQLDASSALKRISVDLDTLNTRTGVRALLIAVRSDILFTMPPYIFCDDGTEKFVNAALGKTTDQLARAYEMWTIHGPSGLATAPTNANQLIAEVRGLVQTKLDDIIATRYPGGSNPVKMNYKSYDAAIVALHGVRLVGWDVPMKNPGQLSMDHVRKMYNGLTNQVVKWELVPPPADGEDPGVAPSRKRQRRADADKIRGPNIRTTGKAAAANGKGTGGSKPSRKRRKKGEDSSEEGEGEESGLDSDE
ncbi:hypothetical protein EXIGLDRAFT_702100 [Exidia glandulosa HHB12029]|uniref:Uncharacterized protein n=1 Tax=Exidia glandulosa HHB12029 TaxID=1314781 RepID=A0A165CPU6_EXIGL|nr:hypothetical protein EXIGLDRAFT_702100 [Exidia glandulosa HHB12029]